MNRRANILARLRRWKSGAGRYVVGAFVVAYLSAGAAPCIASGREAAEPSAVAYEHIDAAHESHSHGQQDAAVQVHTGHEVHGGVAVAHDGVPAHADYGGGHAHCPHCFSGTALEHSDNHSSCLALDDLTNVAASHAKDAPPPLAPSFGPAAFTLPPPLASPRLRPLRVAGAPPVPLNVRHCVFLI